MKPHHHPASTAVALLSLTLAALSSGATERWGVEEVTLRGPSGGHPYLDVQLSARFIQGDRTNVVPGFWDDGDTYRIRFSPPTTGEWRYETQSANPELNGKTGAFTVAAPSANNHGSVEVFNTNYFRHADGTPYHQFGTTCYAWVHQTRELQEQTPLGDDKGNFVLAKPGQYYLVYCFRGKSQSIELPGNSPYKVEVIDPWAMTETNAGTAQPGTYQPPTPDSDVVYRFSIPYQRGHYETQKLY